MVLLDTTLVGLDGPGPTWFWYRLMRMAAPQVCVLLPAHGWLQSVSLAAREPRARYWPQKHSRPYSAPKYCHWLQNLAHASSVMPLDATDAPRSARRVVSSVTHPT